MTEEQIAAQQRENIPKQYVDEPTVAEPTVNSEQATINVDAPLEPMVAYKLASLFGASYEPNETEKTDRLKYIYDIAVESSGSSEFFKVAEYVQGVISLLGAQSTKDPLYTVYQWLKLDAERKRVEREMNLYASRW